MISKIINNCKKKTFEDVPMRVIVSDILPYHLIDFGNPYFQPKKPVKEFTLFGIFKRDRFRTIWMIFSSISISDRFHPLEEDPAVIDFSKIRNLHLTFEFDRGVKQTLLKKSTEMVSLESLYVVNVNANFIRALSEKKEDIFPKLSNLSFHWVEIENFVLVNKNILSRLKNLTLSFVNGLESSFFSSFNDEMIIPQLKYLSLDSLNLKEEVIVSLPKLENLSLCCDNFIPETNENLRKVYISSIKKIPIDIFRISTRIEYIRLEEILFPSFLSFDSQKSLKTLIMTEVTISNAVLHSVISDLKAEELQLSFIKPPNGEIVKFPNFNHLFPNCRIEVQVSFYSPILDDDLVPKFSFSSKEVFISELNVNENDDIMDEHDGVGLDFIFKTYSFPKLKRLKLTYEKLRQSIVYFPSTLDWFSLSSLEYLSLNSAKQISDDFFQERNFPNLEVLVIYKFGYSKNLKGIKWKPLPKLITFKCFGVEESHFFQGIFEENSFPSLQNLEIRSNYSLVKMENYQKWNPLPRLVDITGHLDMKKEMYQFLVKKSIFRPDLKVSTPFFYTSKDEDRQFRYEKKDGEHW